MIRGHIEVVTPDLVQGWICNIDGDTRNRVVLAYSGTSCIGSGKVEVFRRDLAEAGLGDGYLGFSFPISVDKSSLDSVTVKLDGSDAVLLQPHATVTGRAERPLRVEQSALARELAMLKWQLEHARVSQSDYDFLRILWSFGVYERSLLRRDEIGQAAVAHPAVAAATSLLESYLGIDAQITANSAVTEQTFAAELKKVAANPYLAPVVALYSSDKIAVRVLEGSHVDDAGNAPTKAQQVEYKLNAKNLIILDARTDAEVVSTGRCSINMVTACPALP